MLKEDIDYYINEQGNYVFTERYHLQRGYCCKNVCKHCPWKFKQEKQPTKTPINVP